ncbi:MAG: endonuclease/exonuclease/phosphatase family protein [Cyclobacteriaceae bacterium]|nr:endonuclease/exonuclease/phosphatase family protein [Cyclobacteriaceae bacterium]
MNIKKLLTLTSALIAIILLSFIVFYFWASSSNYSKEEYSQLIKNDYPEIIDKDSVYNIITYNIGYLSGMTNNLPVAKTKLLFNNNLIKVYQEFDRIKADIICFQEVDYHSKRSYYVNQQQEIQKIGYNYVFQAVNWDLKYLPYPYFPIKFQFGEMLSGQSILSKYPLADAERIVLSRVANSPFYRNAFYLDRLAQVCKIVINGKTVVLINVHLEAFDEITKTNHANYIVELYSTYKDRFPVLLTGDFNSDIAYGNAAIKTILGISGIKSAVNIHKKTFPSVFPTKRLDYIFYNEKFIELKSAKILTSFGDASDHLPVMMEFKLK